MSLGKFQGGVASPAPRPHPYWLLIGWGSPHPLFPLVLPLCHPLGAGSSAGDVPSNPTVRGREGGNFTFPCCRFTLTLNAFEVLFFKKKKVYIYIFRFVGGGNFFFSLVLIKWGVGVFKCCAPGLSHLGQLCKEGCPTRLGVPPPTPGTSLPSLWLLPLFYEELRCCNFLEPQFFGFLFG